jgi:hypothetical protein
MLANKTLFGLTATTSDALEDEARTLAAAQKKSSFALKYAIEETQWAVPLYIAEGLRWLAETQNLSLSDPKSQMAAKAVAAEGGLSNATV